MCLSNGQVAYPVTMLLCLCLDWLLCHTCMYLLGSDHRDTLRSSKPAICCHPFCLLWRFWVLLAVACETGKVVSKCRPRSFCIMCQALHLLVLHRTRLIQTALAGLHWREVRNLIKRRSVIARKQPSQAKTCGCSPPVANCQWPHGERECIDCCKWPRLTNSQWTCR